MSTGVISKTQDKALFGFWLYLMTDLALFATLFAIFAVLRSATAGGPNGAEITDLPYVLLETIILLTSSFTAGLALISANAGNKNRTLIYLGITFLLGLSFVGLELNEFNKLIGEGHSWEVSAFLSAFFTLVGTHGLHITAGLVWLSVMAFQIGKRGLKPALVTRLTMFSLFWHFLDIVWIFIFTIVYLLGATQ
jgi:cytochrome o ubiquinol oxidase subunit 3